MINRSGIAVPLPDAEETGAGPDEVDARLHLVRDVFGLEPRCGLPSMRSTTRCPRPCSTEMLIDTGRLVVRATLWFLRRRRERMPIAEVLGIFQPGLAALQRLPECFRQDRIPSATAARFMEQGVPAELARGLPAWMPSMRPRCDRGGPGPGEPRGHRAALFRPGRRPRPALDRRAHHGAADGDVLAGARPERAARRSPAQQRFLATTVARLWRGSADPAAMIDAWKERYAQAIERLKAMRRS